MANLSQGDKFGDYTVVRLLGKGGMGSVYLLQTKGGGQVAAKILDSAASADRESRKRFLREAELAMGVKHPNLVETYDVGEDPDTGLCYILMEFVPGGSLADYLKENGALPVEDAIAVVEAMAAVLELARQKGVVHRDIKPANIMFDAEGTPKLADLGIARGGVSGVETTTVTQTGMMIGTPAYMAPEQMLDAHGVDTRADIYSLGVVFFEMLTGERPNKDDTVVQLMAKAVKGDPLPDVRTLRPEVSASLAQLLAMMVVPDKDGRISTPGQITNALAIIERGGTFKTKANSAQREVAGRIRIPSAPSVAVARRSFPWKMLIPVAVLGTLAAAFVLLAPKREPDRSPVAVSVPERVTETPVIRTVVQTNIIEKTKTIERVDGQPREIKAYRSPYVLNRISELGPNMQGSLKHLASCRRSGQRRGVMVFGTLKIDGICSGSDVASWARLGDDGWFCADIWPDESGENAGAYVKDGRRLLFLKHGYGPVEVDLSREADREWSDCVAYDLGCLEMKRLSEDSQCALSFSVKLPSDVREAEACLRLDNRRICGFDWGTSSPHQHPKVEVLRRQVRSDEQIRMDGCTPTDYELVIQAEGCVRFQKRIDLSDVTSRNLREIRLRRPKRAMFALRPFVGERWETRSVVVDGAQRLEFGDGKSRHMLRFYPYEESRGLTVDSFHGSSAYDDYGGLTTNLIDRQLAAGTLASPVSLRPRFGKVEFHPGRIYRFRNSWQPTDMLIAFLGYREEMNEARQSNGPGIATVEGKPRGQGDDAGQPADQPTAVAALPSRTFALPKKRTLELVGCPAGEFQMGHPKAPADKSFSQAHEVVITRPFWIGRHPVTRAQWSSLMNAVPMDALDKALGGLEAPVSNISMLDVGEFCQRLTRRSRGTLPKGYVFRLPTDAEWEYAACGGSSDPEDPHVAVWVPPEVLSRFAVLKEEKMSRLAKAGIQQIPDGRWFVGTYEVCTKKPNGWGLYDILGNVDEMVLDRFSLEKPDGSCRRNGDEAKSGVTYQPVETDPLRRYDKSDVIGLIRSGLGGGMRLRRFILPSARVPPVGFRVVLGPDLEREKALGAKTERKTERSKKR